MRKTGSIFLENLPLNWFVFPGKKYQNPVQFSTYSMVEKSEQFRFNFPPGQLTMLMSFVIPGHVTFPSQIDQLVRIQPIAWIVKILIRNLTKEVKQS